jgi:Arc/MetJ-type ribon-helix-helix transcriptional regulator
MQKYDEKIKRVTVAMPKTLYGQVFVKIQFSNYSTISELIRHLLREWMDKEILEVKPIGRIDR